MKKLTVLLVIIILFFFCCKKNKPYKSVSGLRKTYSYVKYRDVGRMVRAYGFYDSRRNPGSKYRGRFRVRINNKEKVVEDLNTKLMWHISGSEECMTFDKALEWIKALNRDSYSGFNDWRLPTVEEAASLLQNIRGKRDLYRDKSFVLSQIFIWTGDKYSEGTYYTAGFTNGTLFTDSMNGCEYVKPVRSILNK